MVRRLCAESRSRTTLNSQLSTSPEAYAASADASGVKIAANTLAGVRWASYTLRQLAIAKRGTLKTEGMFMSAAHAAWGSPVSHGVSFERSLRMIGTDMKVSDYLDTGHLNNQVPHRWWGN